jgi:hypothetical protein
VVHPSLLGHCERYGVSGGGSSLICESKVNGNDHRNGDGLSVEQRRLVFPLPNRVQGSGHEQRISRHDFHLGYIPLLVDHAINFHVSLDSRLLGQDRIDRLDLPKQGWWLHSAANAVRTHVRTSLDWRWRGDDLTISSKDSAEDASQLAA